MSGVRVECDISIHGHRTMVLERAYHQRCENCWQRCELIEASSLDQLVYAAAVFLAVSIRGGPA